MFETRIAIFGLGYIGYSTAIWFAKAGVEVIGTDIDEEKVRLINSGQLPIKDIEPVLPDKFWDAKPIKATTNWTQLVYDDSIDAFFIAIPTEKDGEPWWKPLKDVVGKIVVGGLDPLVIIESTMAVGTVDKIVRKHLNNIAVAPRRDWFTEPTRNLKTLPRIVGGTTPEVTEEARRILSRVCNELITCTYREAELVKAYENAYRHLTCVLAQQMALAYPNMDIRRVLELGGTKWNVEHMFPNLLGTGGYCLKQGTQIYVADGSTKPIEKITIEDKVIGSDGKLHSIIKVFSRKYDTDLIKIKMDGAPPLFLTPEHPIMISHRNNRNYFRDKNNYPLKTNLSNPKWIKVEDACIGDFLLMPKPNVELSEISEDIAILCGFYLTEGCCDGRKGRAKHRVSFGFHDNEIEHREKITEIIELMGFRTTTNKNSKHGTVLRCSSKSITQLLISLCGERAHLKKADSSLMWSNQQEKLLKTLWDGDGSWKGKRPTYASVSRALANQVRLLLLSQNIASTMRIEKSRIDKNMVNHKESYYVRMALGKLHPRVFIKDEFLHFPIRKIENQPYSGVVYNLEVEGTNDYLTESGIVHNCIPLAPKYILEGAEEPRELTLIKEAVEIDDAIVNIFRILGAYKVGCLGLSYMGNIKVHILSPLVRLLRVLGAGSVKVNDPLYTDDEITAITGCESFKYPDNLDEFEVILLLAAHDEYRGTSELIQKTKDCEFVFDNTGLWKDVKFRCPYYLSGQAGWMEALNGDPDNA